MYRKLYSREESISKAFLLMISQTSNRVMKSELWYLVRSRSVYLISNSLMSKVRVLLAGIPGKDLLP